MQQKAPSVPDIQRKIARAEPYRMKERAAMIQWLVNEGADVLATRLSLWQAITTVHPKCWRKWLKGLAPVRDILVPVVEHLLNDAVYVYDYCELDSCPLDYPQRRIWDSVGWVHHRLLRFLAAAKHALDKAAADALGELWTCRPYYWEGFRLYRGIGYERFQHENGVRLLAQRVGQDAFLENLLDRYYRENFDGDVRLRASAALSGLPGERGEQHLRKVFDALLAENELAWRILACLAQQDTAIVERLHAMIASHNASVQQNIGLAIAFASQESEVAARRAVSLLFSGSADVSQAIADGFGALDVQASLVAPMIVDQLRNPDCDPIPGNIERALQVLDHCTGVKIWELCVALQHDGATGELAAKLLDLAATWPLSVETATHLLIDFIRRSTDSAGHAPPDGVKKVAQILGRSDTQDAFVHSISLMCDPSPNLVVLGVVSLTELALRNSERASEVPDEAIANLVDVVCRHPNIDEFGKVSYVLTWLGERGRAALVRLLSSSDALLRARVCSSLWDMGCIADNNIAMLAIRALETDPDFEVRWNAAMAFLNVRVTLRALEALLGALEDENPVVRSISAVMIGWAYYENCPPPAIVPRLCRLLVDETIWIDDGTIPPMGRLTKTVGETVVQALARLHGKCGPLLPTLSYLEELAANSPEWAMRNAARRALPIVRQAGEEHPECDETCE